jgi:hypothetical protein
MHPIRCFTLIAYGAAPASPTTVAVLNMLAMIPGFGVLAVWGRHGLTMASRHASGAPSRRSADGRVIRNSSRYIRICSSAVAAFSICAA